jgi:hypothetical protein
LQTADAVNNSILNYKSSWGFFFVNLRSIKPRLFVEMKNNKKNNLEKHHTHRLDFIIRKLVYGYGK